MGAYNKNQPETIQKMFNSIASNYDRTNAVLSFCMHHLWNATLVRKAVAPIKPEVLVDLCAGTGEIAFRSIKAVPSLKDVRLIDFSPHMLECAKQKAEKSKISSPKLSYIQANVQELPLEDNTIDCMTMAYGIRNVCDRKACFKEVFRALRNNGTFTVLELTEPSNKILKTFHSTYLKTALPFLGKWLTSDKEAYSYLCNSIHSFIKPEMLQNELLEAGFYDLKTFSLVGGVATLFIARKVFHHK